jgi:hypothetical protein
MTSAPSIAGGRRVTASATAPARPLPLPDDHNRRPNVSDRRLGGALDGRCHSVEAAR